MLEIAGINQLFLRSRHSLSLQCISIITYIQLWHFVILIHGLPFNLVLRHYCISVNLASWNQWTWRRCFVSLIRRISLLERFSVAGLYYRIFACICWSKSWSIVQRRVIWKTLGLLFGHFLLQIVSFFNSEFPVQLSGVFHPQCRFIPLLHHHRLRHSFIWIFGRIIDLSFKLIKLSIYFFVIISCIFWYSPSWKYTPIELIIDGVVFVNWDLVLLVQPLALSGWRYGRSLFEMIPGALWVVYNCSAMGLR